MRGRRGHRGTVDVQPGVLLLPLGAAVLEPDLHLRLRKAERQRQVEPLANGQVAGGLELVLQGHQLLVRERCPGPSGLPNSTAPSVPSGFAAGVARRVDGGSGGGGGGGGVGVAVVVQSLSLGGGMLVVVRQDVNFVFRARIWVRCCI